SPLFVLFVLHSFSSSLPGTVLSMRQPFWFARASRYEHRSEGEPGACDMTSWSFIPWCAPNSRASSVSISDRPRSGSYSRADGGDAPGARAARSAGDGDPRGGAGLVALQAGYCTDGHQSRCQGPGHRNAPVATCIFSVADLLLLLPAKIIRCI